jgi:hypothetical protein
MVNAVEKAKNAVVKIDKYSIFNGIERSTGTGSGFVFSSDGMILTYAYGELPDYAFSGSAAELLVPFF